ncbi:hypothetical protein [Tolypothrix sp. VBCCA 56010]|uniref:hypothetical protein n=1 Tax=Tolypothrix sp. VBCCA 56010 TaxID=3137731 RepID=UPI003D7CA194
MSRANKYQKQATLGLIGLACIATPLFIKLPAQFHAFHAEMQIENSEQIERSRIEQRRQTADTLAQAGVLPNGQKLKIRRYYDDPKHDPKPETTGWLEDETVFVYDTAGVCIGRIEHRQWRWKHRHKNACSNLPVM